MINPKIKVKYLGIQPCPWGKKVVLVNIEDESREDNHSTVEYHSDTMEMIREDK
jgi:hypothetical protein